ncbi:MAG: MATE family efflux transporter [Bacillota bacterium]
MQNTCELPDNSKVLTNREINKKIVSMILPITIENLLQMVAGIVSMGMIGRIDVLAVSALGISMRITQIIWALFKGITTGATVYVAQYYGAGNHKKMLHVIQQTLLSTIAVVIALQAVIYLFAPRLLMIFNPKEELLRHAVIYLKTVSLGLPFLAIMLVIGGVLQGMGNAKTPMFITLIMNFVNILVGYVLIFGKLGLQPMGIRGAGIATAVSQGIAALLGIYILFCQKGVLRTYFNKGFFKRDMKQVKDVYRVGMPSAMESIFWQLAAIILTRAVLTYGETAFAAHQLGMQAESISYMPALGFAIAATTFVGQALGAQDPELAKKYLKQIIKGAVVITSISVGILVFLPKTMMSLLTNNSEVIALGAVYLILMGLVQLPQNISGVLYGVMRGAGHTRVPMTVAGIGLWGIRVPFTLIAVYLLKLPVAGIWVVMSIDLASRFFICLWLFKRKNIFESRIVIEKE